MSGSGHVSGRGRVIPRLHASDHDLLSWANQKNNYVHCIYTWNGRILTCTSMVEDEDTNQIDNEASDGDD